MRIAIFGGAFNPIHTGHIVSAIDIHSYFILDKLIMLPAGIPPHKKDNMANAEYRYQMIGLAIKDFPFLEVSRFEIDKNAVNYTVDSINYFLKEYEGSNIFYIIGADAFYYIDAWKDFDIISKRMSFITLNRPHYDLKKTIEKYSSYFKFVDVNYIKQYPSIGGTVYVFNSVYLDISSSEIRYRIKEKKSIRYLTPDSVVQFIEKKRLYKL